jgi:hypothetical protein
MLEILLGLHGTPRAEASLFFFDAAARSRWSKTKRDIFPALHKTRAHAADAEGDCFFSLHGSIFPALDCPCNYLRGRGIFKNCEWGSLFLTRPSMIGS